MQQRDELMQQRDELMQQRDELMQQRDELIRSNQPEEARESDPLPAVLFNTLPKSASVYILEILAGALDKPILPISSGYFPRDLMDFRQFSQFINVKAIAQSHLDASVFNQKYIQKIDKVIIQFRDPRQATLSWLHHLERLDREKQIDLLDTITPTLPTDYFGLNLAAKIDYQLKFYLPQVVTWISEWLEFVDCCHEPERIMLNTFESFVSDQKQYFTDIFSFLGCGEPSEMSLPEIRPTTERNFRLGRTNEWKSVFTKKQCEIATDLIPSKMALRFNWY